MPNPVSPTSTPSSSENGDGSYDDPYYIHHFDNTGGPLVSQVLTWDNYASWSRSMTMDLSIKNKLDFVIGELSRSSPTEADRLKS